MGATKGQDINLDVWRQSCHSLTTKRVFFLLLHGRAGRGGGFKNSAVTPCSIFNPSPYKEVLIIHSIAAVVHLLTSPLNMYKLLNSRSFVKKGQDRAFLAFDLATTFLG